MDLFFVVGYIYSLMSIDLGGNLILIRGFDFDLGQWGATRCIGFIQANASSRFVCVCVFFFCLACALKMLVVKPTPITRVICAVLMVPVRKTDLNGVSRSAPITLSIVVLARGHLNRNKI